jgi:hypothetical protein
VGPHVANRPSGGGAVNPSPNCPVFAADAVTRVRQLCQRPTARKAGREWRCRFGNKATPSPSSPSRFERSGRPTLRPPTRRAPWSLFCGGEAWATGVTPHLRAQERRGCSLATPGGVRPGRSLRFEVSRRDGCASCSDPSRWLHTGVGIQVGSRRSPNPPWIAKAFPPVRSPCPACAPEQSC